MLENKKKTRRINYKPNICQNAAFPLNGIAFEQSINWMLYAMSGRKQLRHGQRGRSLLGQSSRCLAIMTRPVLTKPFKAWSMSVILILVYDILISSQPYHSFVPNWHALNYWLAYTLTDTYFSDGFVTVRPFATKFGWDKGNVPSMKF